MPIINPFLDDDAFTMASLTDSINNLPNNYGRVDELGLFTDRGIRTRTAIIEEKNGVLNLLPTLPVGSPGTQNKMGKRTARSFTVPHIPLDDRILPDEFAGLRAFGSESELDSIADVMADHLQAARNKFASTIEYLRMGALKGIILDADSSTLYNLYTEFGISPKSVNFALGTAGTNVAAKCREVLRHMEDNLLGEVMSGVRALVDQDFFDALIGHPNVEKYWLNHVEAIQLTGTKSDPRKGFTFGGITWEEYRGIASDMNGNARKFIAANEGHCFPMGTLETFQTIYAPANFIETLNTTGVPLYVKQATDAMGRWVDLHIQSNPLPICLRPALLVKVTKS